MHAASCYNPAMVRAANPIRGWFKAVRQTLAAGFDELFPPVVQQELREAEAAGWHIDPPTAYCPRCGATVGSGEATAKGCSHCIGEAIAWDRIVRLSMYTEPIAPWIIAMKYHKQWPWAPWFGEALARSIGPINDPAKTIICPVPMATLRRWRRGFSQTQLMADAFAKETNLRVVPLLRRQGWQRSQTKVIASQRRANVSGAFRIDKVDLSGHDVWLIDDVKTSGATLTACTRLLRSMGAWHVYVAVAAVADPKHADFKLK